MVKIKEFTEEDWKLASYKATVFGAPIAIISLIIIAGAFGFAILQLQSGIDTTNNLAELIHTNQEQTKALQETIEEIQHQTIVNAYANGGTYDVQFERCSFSEHFDQDENFIGTSLNVKPIMVTNQGVQTIVPFYIFVDYEFSGYNEERQKYDSRFNHIDVEKFIYSIETEGSSQVIDIQPLFDEAEEEGYTTIKIIAEYSFRPFSSVKGTSLSDQSDSFEQEFAILKLMENGKWHVQDFREKYPCM